MGTPHFAVPTLEKLLDSPHDVCAVITAPDKPAGRGRSKLKASAVKQCALEHDIDILQPTNLKNKDFQARLRAYKADLQVVVAFRMLPVAVWDMPPLGTMNLHGSLLPAYRGAAPIHWAVMNGETETGCTTFLLKHEIDTGDMLLQSRIPIGPDETTGDIHDRMMIAGADLVLESLDVLKNPDYRLIAQDESKVSQAPKLTTEMCEIDWTQSTAAIHDFIRGLNPFPTAWSTIADQRVKIYASRKVSSIDSLPSTTGYWSHDEKLYHRTGDGAIEILQLKPEGKRLMSAADYVRAGRDGITYVDGDS